MATECVASGKLHGFGMPFLTVEVQRCLEFEAGSVFDSSNLAVCCVLFFFFFVCELITIN